MVRAVTRNSWLNDFREVFARKLNAISMLSQLDKIRIAVHVMENRDMGFFIRDDQKTADVEIQRGVSVLHRAVDELKIDPRMAEAVKNAISDSVAYAYQPEIAAQFIAQPQTAI